MTVSPLNGATEAAALPIAADLNPIIESEYSVLPTSKTAVRNPSNEDCCLVEFRGGPLRMLSLAFGAGGVALEGADTDETLTWSLSGTGSGDGLDSFTGPTGTRRIDGGSVCCSSPS